MSLENMVDETAADSEDSPDETTPDESTESDESGASEKDGQDTDEKEPESKDDEVDPSLKELLEKHPNFKKLASKYGNDLEKMANAVFGSYNSAAELNKQFKELKTLLTQKVEANSQKSIDEIINEDEEVISLGKEYTKTKSDLTTLQSEYSKAITENAKLERNVARLEGKLEVAQLEDKEDIKQELNELKSQQRELKTEIKSFAKDEQVLIEKLKDLQKRGSVAAKAAKERAREKAEEQEREAEEAQQLREQYDSSMRKEAERYGIDVDSKQFKHLLTVNHARIVTYLAGLPDGSPGIDIKKAVEVLMTEWAEANGVKAKFQKQSTVKRQTTVPPKKTTEQASDEKKAPTSSDKWTAAQWKERAKRLMG